MPRAAGGMGGMQRRKKFWAEKRTLADYFLDLLTFAAPAVQSVKKRLKNIKKTREFVRNGCFLPQTFYGVGWPGGRV